MTQHNDSSPAQRELCKSRINDADRAIGQRTICICTGMDRAVWWRMRQDGHVAPKWVLPLERLTESLSRYVTRPDLHPPLDWPPPAPPADAIALAQRNTGGD